MSQLESDLRIITLRKNLGLNHPKANRVHKSMDKAQSPLTLLLAALAKVR